jgi:hypothetical protein
MAMKIISTDAPNRRRAVKLDPATVASIAIKPGQVLKVASTGFAAKADGGAAGATPVGVPVFAFTDSARKDVQSAKAITVIDGPFVAEINNEAFAGTPTIDQDLVIGTGGDVGKLAVQAVSTVAHAMAVVARVGRSVDADGYIMIKVVR